jgi:hypothetical protein
MAFSSDGSLFAFCDSAMYSCVELLLNLFSAPVAQDNRSSCRWKSTLSDPSLKSDRLMLLSSEHVSCYVGNIWRYVDYLGFRHSRHLRVCSQT